jgi:hypothetical protein
MPGIKTRTLKCWTITAAAVAVLGGSASAQVGLGLSPMRLEFGLSPGASQSGPLTLSNESGGPVRVRAELLDFFLDDEGTPQFAPSYPTEDKNSCRTWLSVNPMETEVPQGKSLVIRYTLRVPPNAPVRSFHCAVGFTTLPVLQQLQTTGLRTAVRMVAAFYAVVGHPAIEGEVSRMTLEYVKTAGGFQWLAVVVLRNAGLNHFRPSGDFTLLDDRGVVIETAQFPALPVLPEREQRFHFPLKAELGQRKYTLRARVDLGAAEVQETTVTLVPSAPGK